MPIAQVQAAHVSFANVSMIGFVTALALFSTAGKGRAFHPAKRRLLEPLATPTGVVGVAAGAPCPSEWDLIYFLHCQKTAGVLLTENLCAALDDDGNATVMPAPAGWCWCPREALPGALYKKNCHHTPTVSLSADLLGDAMCALCPGRCAGFATHEDYGLLGALLDSAQRRHTLLLTMLREPVDRVISEYHYYKTFNTLPHLEGIHNATEHTGLLMYARLRSRRNLITHLLAGQTQCQRADAAGRPSQTLAAEVAAAVGLRWLASVPPGHPDVERTEEQMLAAAKIQLGKFCWVGIYERMEESLALLRWSAGWEGLRMQGWDHVILNNHLDVLGEVRQQIAQVNTLDIKLYQYAVGLFEERLRAAGLGLQRLAGAGMA